MTTASLKLFGAIALLALSGFGLVLGLAFQAASAAQAGGGMSTCGPSLANATQMAGHHSTPAAQIVTATATASAANSCVAGNRVGAQVVAWAREMADALTVNPTCGLRRTAPDCDTYAWYTSAFPKAVVQYGQDWCQKYGGCAVWQSGNYQCVSFVRGAYSQVYPMNLTGDAFDLWTIYQHQPGWREIPSAAGDVTTRSLPEPGDVMIFKDQGVGHVAIVLSVTAPHHGKNGDVSFANANSTSPYDHMPLLPNLLVDTSAWTQNHYVVWGYLRAASSASSALTRISQLDPAQYGSPGEFKLWAYSACSAAAMTEVLNAYGFRLRIQDVLNVERSLTVPGSNPPEPYITPQLGLTAEAGIAATMQHFGFTTTWSDTNTLAQIVRVANSGIPVIVSWPPARYDGGHIVVVIGGNATSVFIADSSAWNRHVLTNAQFLSWWGGFAAISTPMSMPGISS